MERRAVIGLVGLGMSGLAGCTSTEEEPEQVDTETEARERVSSSSSVTEQGTEIDSDTEQDTETESEPTEATTPEAVIGEVVEGDRLSMVVRSVSRTQSIGEFQQADEGNTFVVIRLAVKNTTRDSFADFSGFLQNTLTDDQDYNYDPVITVTETSFQAGQLAPGEVSRGDIVFEVPEEASGLRLLFDFEAFSFTDYQQVLVNLSEESSSRGDLTQTLQIETYQPEDAVEFNGTTTTVNSVEFARQVGGQYGATAADGNTFAIVDVSVTNETGEEQSVSTALQMKAKDGAGFSYRSSISATSQLDRRFAQGSPIPNGETRRGKIAYEVPQRGHLYWTFEFSLFADGDKTFWTLRE